MQIRTINKHFIFSSIAVVLATFANAQWTYWDPNFGGNGHYYRIELEPNDISWTDASTVANSYGGYLATLTSQAENAFVAQLASDPIYWNKEGAWRGPWLGGWQESGAASAADGWHWVTGESWGFTNWAAGEPNDAIPTEDKLHLFNLSPTVSDTWNDLTDTTLEEVHSYVVEMVPEPATTALLCPALLATLLRRGRRH